MTPQLHCKVIDAGARYGLHPTWNDLRDVVDFELFEMDAVEAARLKKIYSGYPNIRVHSCALYSSRCVIKYQVRKHQGLTSLLDNNMTFIGPNKYLIEESACEAEAETEAWSVDLLFGSEDIHFMKIDTEGTELEVLKGAASKLNSTILGVQVEVTFEEVYKTQPLFGEIHNFMREHDFELINLNYDGRGHPMSEFTLPDKYGKLIDTDAVWIKRIESILKGNQEKLAERVILLALFLLYNHASDLALDLLMRAVQEQNISLAQWKDSCIFSKLERKIAFLFKEMLSSPSAREETILGAFQLLFGAPLPTGHKFYERYSL